MAVLMNGGRVTARERAVLADSLWLTDMGKRAADVLAAELDEED